MAPGAAHGRGGQAAGRRAPERVLTIPEITTERLLLRPPRDDDLDAWAEFHADFEVMRWLGRDRPLDREEAWRELAQLLGHWHLRGFGQWVLEHLDTGELVGRAGLYYPEGWPGLEVGWTLARRHWGKGFATEAGRAALDWAFGTLNADHVISLVAPANERSRRVAERLGETFEGRTRIRGHLVDVFGVDRPGAA